MLMEPSLKLAIFSGAVLGSVSMAFGIVYFVCVIGGWKAWADLYPDTTGHRGRKFSFESGSFSLGQYRGLLTFSADSDGMVLSTFSVFSRIQKPIRLPWSDLTVTLTQRWFGKSVTIVAAKAPQLRFEMSPSTYEKLRVESDGNAPNASPE